MSTLVQESGSMINRSAAHTPETDSEDHPPRIVVGIGASAGGIPACRTLLEHLPVDAGIAYVIIQHLAPEHESHIAEILKSATRLPITQISSTKRLKPNHVYVIAPATSLLIRGGVLEVGKPEQPHFRARPIDAFFSSLGASLKEGAVGIVLSGTGDDGSAGLKEIQAGGGLCLVQEPDTAEFDAMPRSAIKTGVADAVVAPEEMGKILEEFSAAPSVRPALHVDHEGSSVEPGEGLEAILALLSKQYGVNFHDYKMGTLRRRTARRMGLHQLTEWPDYLEHLHAHPEEVEALYRDVLIGVTGFFRDSESWRYLEEKVVPELLDKHDRNMPVRVWSAGCATGEEAYSLAMVFLEQIERRGSRLKLQVFASDLSHEALAVARHGVYHASIEPDISEERLHRFFHRVEEGFQVDRALRDAVTFASHSLLSSPPFASLDLVSCRNVLIYLQPPAQERILELFHFALRAKGILWLGSSETNGQRAELFNVCSSKHRMYFPTAAGGSTRQQVPRWVEDRSLVHGLPKGKAGPRQESKVARRLEQFVLQRYTTACVIVDSSFDIRYFFGPTAEYLTMSPGEARLDLLSWIRPGMYAKLRAGLTEAVANTRMTTVTDMRVERDSGTARVEITIDPLASVPDADGLLLVVFRDIPQAVEVATRSVTGSSAEERLIHQLEEELKDTRLELQSSGEQLDTVNEEYRASHEELLSLNEELQSGNEELESSKEELQSLNEELMTINHQLEDRNAELHGLTSDLNNILVATAVPTLFLNRKLQIRRFTPTVSQIMRIFQTDVGRPFNHLSMHVLDENLLADAQRVLDLLVPIEAEVSADDGRCFIRRVLPYRTEDERIDGVCITYHDISGLKRAAVENEEARAFAEAIIRASRTPILVLDARLRVISANESFYRAFQTLEGDTIGRGFFELGNHHWNIPLLRSMLDDILPREGAIRDYDVEHGFENIGWRVMSLNGSIMKRADLPDLILLSIEDVTDLRRAEAAAQRHSDELVRDHRLKDEFLAMLGHELRNPLSALANGLHLVQRTADIPERVILAGAMMDRQIQRMTTLLDQLLDVARVTSGKLDVARKVVDVADAARSAIETITPMMESARQALIVGLPPAGTALVLGDWVRLAQVVENLLANSAKYTESGGSIWLTIEPTEDMVKLSVRDTGIGMEPELIEHVFDLFTQAPRSLERAQGGLGLGLALVRSLVEMHRGHVEAFSAGLGQGSEFVVTLPRLRTGLVAPPVVAQNGPKRVVPHRVLIVDDEVDAALMLQELLTDEGHEVQVVHEGNSALDVARTFNPEVILLDLGLPGMNGYEVAGRLRDEHGAKMRIVAMTGYQKDTVRLKEAGFDDHLVKPPELNRVFSSIADFDVPAADGVG